jgi:hypothetical protein
LAHRKPDRLFFSLKIHLIRRKVTWIIIYNLGDSGLCEPFTLLIDDVPPQSEQATRNLYDLIHALVVDDSPMNRKMLRMHLNGF